MPRRGPRRINVIGVGTPPPLPPDPLAIETVRHCEVKQAAERQPDRKQRLGRDGAEQTRRPSRSTTSAIGPKQLCPQ